MKTIIIQLITAFLGSLGFSMLFGMRRKHVFPAALGGLLAWGVYLAVHAWMPGIFLPNLIAAVFSAAYAEFLAHIRKCPATLFLILAIIPLVPGSSLYYAMDAAVNGEFASAGEFGHMTLVCALAIAAGISLVSVIHQLRKAV